MEVDEALSPPPPQAMRFVSSDIEIAARSLAFIKSSSRADAAQSIDGEVSPQADSDESGIRGHQPGRVGAESGHAHR
jgi:hypothetical protein